MSPDERIDALERQVAALSEEVRLLRASIPPRVESQAMSPDEVIRERLRHPPVADRMHASADWIRASSAVHGAELESLVGRYGTLVLAALVILMAVGAVIKMAVQRGLLTPEVRILGGLLVAIALAIAGLVFRARGEARYGGVLLALSLAVIDLVAWGAGPTFHLVTPMVALGVVATASVFLAGLALHDESEFMYAVAIAGALSAPFVTADREGTALALLSYGGVVIAGGILGARASDWMRVFLMLVAGALVFALAAASLPMSAAWYGPFLILLFTGGCAFVALCFGAAWRGELPRALLGVGVVGALVPIDVVSRRPLAVVLAVTMAFAMVTYAALQARDMPARFWRASALLLPFISLLPAVSAPHGDLRALVVTLWGVLALMAWQLDAGRRDADRSATHLLAAGFLGSIAVTLWLWGTPLAFVAGLAAWGALHAWLGQGETSPIALNGVLVASGGAALSAIDQLASRNAYGYTPFLTRSSASALCAAVGLAIALELVRRGRGGAASLVDRGVRTGLVVSFLIVWGRMELAHAYSADLAAFLLTSYYAACGVGSIIAGRQLSMSRLRVAGLTLAIYAAVKAVVEVTDISSLLLRVGSYAAVGVFLLGAGYLYRDRRPSIDRGLSPVG